MKKKYHKVDLSIDEIKSGINNDHVISKEYDEKLKQGIVGEDNSYEIPHYKGELRVNIFNNSKSILNNKGWRLFHDEGPELIELNLTNIKDEDNPASMARKIIKVIL